MKRIRSPEGVWWTVATDTAGPRLRWRPAQWWRKRRADKAAKREQSLVSADRDRAGEKKSRWWDWLDIPAFDFDDLWIGLIILGGIAGLFLLAVLLGWVVLPLILILLDGILLLVGTTVLFVWRTATRSGWSVTATSDDGRERLWHSDGWRAARRTEKAITEALAAGSPIVTPDATETLPG